MELASENSPVEVEARTWLSAHKADTGHSWADLAGFTDVAQSTLSLFTSGKYEGRNDPVAVKVLAYRDRLSVQAEIAMDAPQVPEWYDTPTATRLWQLLQWAQSGKMVLIVSTPGVGKTKTVRRFAARDPNVWLATMAPSTAGVATMAIEVAAAIGLGEIKGSPQQLSRQIKAKVAGRRGLIVVDEAQELTDKALNELRSWHDATGVGVALLGNEKVVGQLDSKRSALAQVSSRISLPLVQMGPMPGDLDALFAAWGIADERQRAFLTRIGNLLGALREVTMTLEVALMAGGGLTLELLRDAAKQRNVRLAGL
ncbi:AAA family ATPase [Sphingomonas bacterium]|uniref:AAA family ATPase n=1 Tax=Sphingomonas bacterium TaxID=1895847 RepID=UPI001576013D|nr:AAA family ATPase [Sphingomonas bacterium]